MKWLVALVTWIMGWFNSQIVDPWVGYVVDIPTPTVVELEISPTVSMAPTRKLIITKVPTKIGSTAPWGVAQQVDEHTWTMKIAMDARMATPVEILSALNDYRVRRGSQRLIWDDKLASYAQGRANYLYTLKNVDGHKGFDDFLNNQNGFEKLGFSWLGENISYGYRMEGVHLIEWIYAGDKPHDDNQVNNRWNYVGIGVKGTATCLIFGTGKQ